jgi:cell division protein FtsI/penicillin-binding protein 2
VDRIERRDGTVSREAPPIRTNLEKAGLHAEDLEVVREAMRWSVSPEGNARKGAIPGFQVGGRTGTAQIWRNGAKKDNLTAFVGFAASEKARYAFSVLVQGAKSGGGVAAPLAARIIASIGKDEPGPLDPAKGAFDFVESLEGAGPSAP